MEKKMNLLKHKHHKLKKIILTQIPPLPIHLKKSKYPMNEF